VQKGKKTQKFIEDNKIIKLQAKATQKIQKQIQNCLKMANQIIGAHKSVT
jgi:hypothetical protein